MPKSLTDILGNNDMISEDVRTELSEAFEARIAEQREEITAELREEFAARYENDKAQIVDAMDVLMNETIKSELDEFAQDKAKLAEDRVAAKRSVKEHITMLESFIQEVLAKEIKELREDRKTHKANFGKLEEFVLKQLTNELNEFHEDKRSLAEQKVKMVREGKNVINEAKENFIKKSAASLENIVDTVLRKELSSLREDIQTAKENEFGRKIFETFASEFMTSTLSENTQVSKLAKEILDLKATIAEANDTIEAKDKQLVEANRSAKVAQDLSERKAIMSEMLGPLNKDQKDLMRNLLESVKTSKLKGAYKKYLPSVIAEENTIKTQTTKTKITEGTKVELNGDKVKADQSEIGGTADIIELKKLAGLS